MAEAPDGVDRISAVLIVECPRHHYVGRLLIARGDRWIEYWRADNTIHPEWWNLTDTGMLSERCPGGCRREVGATRHELMRRLMALADDPDRDEWTVTSETCIPNKAGDHMLSQSFAAMTTGGNYDC